MRVIIADDSIVSVPLALPFWV